MKIVYIITTLVFIIAMAWVLAFMGIIPAQKIADKNASARGFLKALHLAKDPKPKPVVAAVPAPAPDADNPIKQIGQQRAQLEAQKAVLDQEKADLDAEKTQIAAAKQSTATASTGDRQKLLSIYATMSPDDIAQILTDVPDKAVLADLASMDEKKAGKVLAALPAERAALISEMMAGGPLPKSSPAASTASAPTTSPSTQTAAAATLPKKAL